MSATSAGFVVAPAAGIVLFAQTVADVATAAGDPTGMGLIRLVTDTAVGACVLIAVFLFLRRDKERDQSVKAIADDFRADVRSLADRVEEIQSAFIVQSEKRDRDILALTRDVIVAMGDVKHAVQGLDQTAKTLGDRMNRVEHHVFVSPMAVAESTNRIEGPRQ